ncbi:ABC transporter [Gemelliphila palaticanis]|uniref:ABC transporter n=1 Tax=Gemelliphila palaticanis TaxID=81950 RepID=A0ABX2SYT4_9BACL|nr:ABC transporter [Gemella palaticanis]MBF0715577.1 ABC transporter [Gemella palaticanis]NYS47507.1 ABC transporter [Gemella palaticanis]
MNSFRSEFNKIFKETLTYYPDFLVSIVINIILFVIIFTNNNDITVIISFSLWVLVSGVLSEASLTISTEKQLGTLQNLMIRPVSILETITNKTIIWILINLIKIIFIVFILSFFYNIEEIFDLRLLLIFIITVFGIFGFSLILAVLTLIYTKVASFESIISYGLLYLSGAFLEIPDFLRYTNSLSYATYIIKNIDNISINNYLYLVFISIFWLSTGILLFKYIFSKSKNFNWNY